MGRIERCYFKVLAVLSVYGANRTFDNETAKTMHSVVMNEFGFRLLIMVVKAHVERHLEITDGQQGRAGNI